MAHGAKPLPTSDARPVRLGDLDLAAHLTDPARKQAFVTPMFDVIAPRYDDFTRLFSFGMDAGWKAAAIRAVTSAVSATVSPTVSASAGGGQAVRDVLDLACGTGDLAVGMARALPQSRVTAIDASPRMIEAAVARLHQRDRDLAPRVTARVGDMIALDLPDASIDLVTAGYGVRNVPDAATSIREMRRVLRPGGRLMLLDFYRPESALWRSLLLGYLKAAGNVVGWWWHRDPVVYGYIAHSIDHFMSWQACRALLTAEGFRVERVTRYLGGGVARHDAVAT